MKIIVRLLVAALLLAGMTSCSSPAPEQRADEASPQPTRILSLAPSTTETLFAIGAGDDIIGVTDFCSFPPAARDKPRMGGFHNPNVEAMIAARPTIAFHSTGTRGLEDQLHAAGIKVVSVPSVRLSDVASGLRICGKALNREGDSHREVVRFEEAIARLRAACASKKKPRVLLVLSRTPGPVRQIFSVGPETFLDDLLDVVGAENALADSPAPYPQPSLEEIVVNPPNVIIEDRSDLSTEIIDQVRREWAQALGPQAGKVRVEVISDPHLSVPGPGIVASAERLARIVHPGLVFESSGS